MKTISNKLVKPQLGANYVFDGRVSCLVKFDGYVPRTNNQWCMFRTEALDMDGEAADFIFVGRLHFDSLGHTVCDSPYIDGVVWLS